MSQKQFFPRLLYHWPCWPLEKMKLHLFIPFFSFYHHVTYSAEIFQQPLSAGTKPAISGVMYRLNADWLKSRLEQAKVQQWSSPPRVSSTDGCTHQSTPTDVRICVLNLKHWQPTSLQRSSGVSWCKSRHQTLFGCWWAWLFLVTVQIYPWRIYIKLHQLCTHPNFL